MSFPLLFSSILDFIVEKALFQDIFFLLNLRSPPLYCIPPGKKAPQPGNIFSNSAKDPITFMTFAFPTISGKVYPLIR